jgi:hypothetical protein
MDNLLEVFSRDRPFSQRHNFKTALRVRVWKSGLPEERAESLGLSQRGIQRVLQELSGNGGIVNDENANVPIRWLHVFSLLFLGRGTGPLLVSGVLHRLAQFSTVELCDFACQEKMLSIFSRAD